MTSDRGRTLRAGEASQAPGRETQRVDLSAETQVNDGSPTGDSSPPKQIGKFELRGQLGQGGIGTVYLGYDPLLQREVAIKVLRHASSKDEASSQRFLTEARAVGQLNHPNTSGIHDIGEEGAEYIAVCRPAFTPDTVNRDP